MKKIIAIIGLTLLLVGCSFLKITDNDCVVQNVKFYEPVIGITYYKYLINVRSFKTGYSVKILTNTKYIPGDTIKIIK